MKFIALATDYDGTLAEDGIVNDTTIAALERLRAASCRIILVTGRELDDLLVCMPRMDLFDLVVAENGALLYSPASGEQRMLAGPPPAAFIERLRSMAIDPLLVGQSIVATSSCNRHQVETAIGELGPGLRVILNKSSLMVLPDCVDKESGLRAALEALGISPADTVAVGDAENDLAFVRLCGLTVAVANAVPSLKAQAGLITTKARGAGVAELIERWLDNGLDAV
jgi:hydroxymethylpyrimidine pyrophosphatase-like HAD family hydrolase